MAKRPNKLCDPYGQGGQPMTSTQAETLLETVDAQSWQLQYHQGNDTPSALVGTFVVRDYLLGAKLLPTLAAVAAVQAHFPETMSLQRRIVRKQWQTCVVVQCRTTVLEGLSQHDFHLAMMMDVEIARPEVQAHLI